MSDQDCEHTCYELGQQQYQLSHNLPTTTGSAPTVKETIQFYLHKIDVAEQSPWPLKLLSINSLLEQVHQDAFLQLIDSTLLTKTILCLVPYLSEKRNHLQTKTSKAVALLLKMLGSSYPTDLTYLLEEHGLQLLEQAVHSRSVAEIIFPQIIPYNPRLHLLRLTQMSLDLKIPKRKLIALQMVSIYLPQLHERESEQTAIRVNKTRKEKGIPALVKLMCKHLEVCAAKDNELARLCKNIICSAHDIAPAEVLLVMLCQNGKTLSRLIQLAEQAGQQFFKSAIVDYISSVKGTITPNTDNFTNRSNLCDILHRIQSGQQHSLQSLAQFLFMHLKELTSQDFKHILDLLFDLTSSDLILEYQILAQELVETVGFGFVKEIMLRLAKSCQESEEYDPKTKQSNTQHTNLSYVTNVSAQQSYQICYTNLISLALDNNKLDTVQQICEITETLLQVYRGCPSLMLRKAIIGILTKCEDQTLREYASNKQLLLIRSQRNRLLEAGQPNQS